MGRDLFATEAPKSAGRDLFGSDEPPTEQEMAAQLAEMGAGEQSLRYGGAFSQGMTDSLAGAVGAVPDLVASGLRTVGVPLPEGNYHTEALREGIGSTGQMLAELLTGEEVARPDYSQSEDERIFNKAGEWAGNAASFALPAGVVSKLATPGTVTQGTAAAMAARPGAQLAAGATGGAVAEATDNPYAGLVAAMGVPVAGGAINLGRDAIKKVGSGIKNQANPAQVAVRDISKAVANDARTPAQVEARLRTLGPQATVADAAGANTRGLARGTASVPGPSKDIASNTFNRRAASEGIRINESLQSSLKPKDFFAAEESMLGGLRSRARTNYAKAYEAGPALESKTLTSLMSRPIAKQAMREARSLAAIEGRTIPAGKAISTEAVDDVKRGLDAIVEKSTNALTGRVDKRGALVTQFKNELLREVDNLNPAYREARLAYGGDAEVLSALRNGADFRKLQPEQIKKQLSGMSEAAKDAYRSGAAQRILQEISKTTDTGSISRKLFGNDMVRKQLKELFPNDQDYRSFVKTLLQERQFSITKDMVTGGSPTARIAAEQAGQVGGGAVDIAKNLAFGRFGDAASGVLRKGMERMTTPKPDVAREISKRLYSQDPGVQQKLLAEMLAAAPVRPQSMSAPGMKELLAETLLQQAEEVAPQNRLLMETR